MKMKMGTAEDSAACSMQLSARLYGLLCGARGGDSRPERQAHFTRFDQHTTKIKQYQGHEVSYKGGGLERDLNLRSSVLQFVDNLHGIS